MMDLRKLKTLIDLVESSGIAELEISEGEERVRITRTVAAAQQIQAAPQQIMMAPANVATAHPVSATEPSNRQSQKATWLNHPWSALFIVRPLLAPKHLWMWASRSTAVKPYALLKR